MTSPAPARKRVSQACVSCGLKKVKCDGQVPTCAPCRDRGIECVYGSSKRSRSRPSMVESPRLRPEAPYGSREDIPTIHMNNPAVAHRQSIQIQSRPQATTPFREIAVSPEISTRLLHTYFNCIHPLWPLLYKPLYASLDFGSPTDMMTPSLVAAIYAIASCVDRPIQHAANSIVMKYPEPMQFFEGALNLLQGSSGATGRMVNALEPSINNCQVLTILALQQHGLAEYSRAAVLCGIASSIAVELRLHRPPNTDDALQSEVHSRLWWNLYIMEKMMSFEMGRPVLLRSEESDCPYPSMAEADEFELMSSQMGIQTFPKKNNSVKLRTISGLHTTIKLSLLMERISREVYGILARKSIRDNQAAGEAKRMELWAALQAWEADMEASPLKLDLGPELSSVPASVTNYVINWHGTIMLHRPFIARWSSNPAASSSPSPHSICLEAARKICVTLEHYFERLLGLPCDMVFSVFITASTLLYHSKISKDDEAEVQRQLQLCIRWLSALGKSWKSAGARHQMLADMFDLPANLRGQDHLGSSSTAPSPGPGSQFGPPKGEHQYGSPAPRAVMDSSASMQSPQDWTFLHEFGDPRDEFYELDVQLRGLLDGGLSPPRMAVMTSS